MIPLAPLTQKKIPEAKLKDTSTLAYLFILSPTAQETSVGDTTKEWSIITVIYIETTGYQNSTSFSFIYNLEIIAGKSSRVCLASGVGGGNKTIFANENLPSVAW